MISTTDPESMTAEDHRLEVAGILAHGLNPPAPLASRGRDTSNRRSGPPGYGGVGSAWASRNVMVGFAEQSQPDGSAFTEVLNAFLAARVATCFNDPVHRY